MGRAFLLALVLRFVPSAPSAILFFDDAGLSNTTGLRRSVGTPKLLSTFSDPDNFLGWGCKPFVFCTVAYVEFIQLTYPPHGSSFFQTLMCGKKTMARIG
jgi:hypothetical protein